MRARNGRARRARSSVWFLAPLMIVLSDSTDVGHRTGIMYLTILSLCSLAGPLTSGTIYHTTAGYSAVGVCALACRFPFFTIFCSLTEARMTYIQKKDSEAEYCDAAQSILIEVI
jgi:hypothetical protein